MTEEDTLKPIQKAVAIETQVGIVTGRDAIYLREVVFVNDGEYCIKGQFTQFSLSGADVEGDLPFNLTFTGVLLWRAVELDFAESVLGIAYESCFDLVENSELLAFIRTVNNGKIDRGYDSNGKFSNQVWHQHFVLSTYDTVFEIIAQHYDLEIGKTESPVYVLVENELKNQKN